MGLSAAISLWIANKAHLLFEAFLPYLTLKFAGGHSS